MKKNKILICIVISFYCINYSFADSINNYYEKNKIKNTIINNNINNCINSINEKELNLYKINNGKYILDGVEGKQEFDTDYTKLCGNVIIGKISSDVIKSIDGKYYFTTSNNSYFRFNRNEKIISFSGQILNIIKNNDEFNLKKGDIILNGIGILSLNDIEKMKRIYDNISLNDSMKSKDHIAFINNYQIVINNFSDIILENTYDIAGRINNPRIIKLSCLNDNIIKTGDFLIDNKIEPKLDMYNNNDLELDLQILASCKKFNETFGINEKKGEIRTWIERIIDFFRGLFIYS